MSGDLEEMVENIRFAEEMFQLEAQYLAEHPNDYAGLSVLRFQHRPGHFHEMGNVLAENMYFGDPVLLEYSIRLNIGRLARGGK